VAGALWGLAVLTRETVLYFTPVLALWLAGRRPGAASLRRGALFALSTFVVVAPWTLRNYVVHQAFIPVSTAGGLNLWQGNARLTRQQVYDRYFAVPGLVGQYRNARRMGLRAIAERQPTWLFEKLRDELPRFWEADSLALVHVERGGYGPVAPAARLTAVVVVLAPYVALLLLFVLALWRLPLDARHALLLGFLGYYTALHVATHGFARYRLPALPVLFLLAAGALVAAPAGPAAGRSRRQRALALAVALVLLGALGPSVRGWVERLGGGAPPRAEDA
jgi:hypothetical protein